MRRTLLRLVTVLALGIGLLAVPFGPGATKEAEAATSNGKIYNKDGDIVMAASFNSGLWYYHAHENASPDKPNFFQVMDKCDDGEGPVVSWTIEGRAVDGWSADDCTGGFLPFKLYSVETGYEESVMASLQWHLTAKDSDGNQLGSTNVINDWVGSYTDDGSDLYTHASFYRDEYDTGGDTLVVTVVPTDKAKGLDVDAIVDSYTAQIWDHVTDRLPRPGTVTDDQAESLYKQLWCHVRFNAYGVLGGHTWDLEAERPNIAWELVTEDIAIHGCNWGTTEDQGWFSRPPTDGGDPENLAPMVDAGPDVSVDEGSAVTLKGTAADDGGTPATKWTYTPGDNVDEGATCAFADPTAPRTTLTCTDDGTYTVKLTADDGVNQPVSDRATVTVRNVAPTLDVMAPKDWDVHRVESEVAVSASFTDPGSNDTHTCKVTWDDGSTSNFPAENGRCDTSHVYDDAGMDTVAVEVTDDDGGGKDDAEHMVVVYDPRAGLASGAGTLDDGLGFTALAKYPTAGSTVPAGAVKLSVPTATGQLTIVSTDLDWLVITPDAKAAVKGRSATHGFLGYLESGRFRGVTWPLSQGEIPPAVPSYDSTPGASWDLDEAQPKPLRTGLTVIDTGWLPGVPQLPAPLGDTVGNLLDALPALRLDLQEDTAA